jgi:hypothetical protein
LSVRQSRVFFVFEGRKAGVERQTKPRASMSKKW